jgi:hypothetical protein
VTLKIDGRRGILPEPPDHPRHNRRTDQQPGHQRKKRHRRSATSTTLDARIITPRLHQNIALHPSIVSRVGLQASLQQISIPREPLKRKFQASVLTVQAPRGATNGAEMQDAETYERYASECERIARTMSGEKRQSLLAIAQAWRELAREAKRRAKSPEP